MGDESRFARRRLLCETLFTLQLRRIVIYAPYNTIHFGPRHVGVVWTTTKTLKIAHHGESAEQQMRHYKYIQSHPQAKPSIHTAVFAPLCRAEKPRASLVPGDGIFIRGKEERKYKPERVRRIFPSKGITYVVGARRHESGRCFTKMGPRAGWPRYQGRGACQYSVDCSLVDSCGRKSHRAIALSN
ncbi:hypothetical protein Cob_v013069 [Colletotrichum orbiculare MAFF 240422]|uniref:Uncharacterized protein n=1 Tax=Colletotrichum orbiculare (strain 104-T / ATCC 96160 / CBS 514.97 / LARS 414 / MAFF 240422) TaxID=1213857 RepID=A0A484F7S7_COLOR|nr:hypothetical protein Cob_v013069 [Colletotrichum orbiculare MAFF 240422]